MTITHILNRSEPLKTFLLVSLGLLSPSCMHVGMIGTNEDRQSTGDRVVADRVLEKQVVRGNVEATATFPPLVRGREEVFELQLMDLESGQPISDATLSFHATYLHEAEEAGEHMAHMRHARMDSAHTRSGSGHSISFDREVKEQSQRGSYSIAFTPSQSGEHTLMFHVTAIGDETLEPELVIEATRNVAPGTANHGGMMHGMSSTSEYLIVGGALMGAMMVAMWATRGSIF